jgi:hypothetical protein
MLDKPESLPYMQCKYRVADAAIIFPNGKEYQINGNLDIPFIILKKDFDNEQNFCNSRSSFRENQVYQTW